MARRRRSAGYSGNMIRVEGLEDLIDMCEVIADESGRIAGRVLYVGAEEVADKMKQGINDIPVDSRGRVYGTDRNPLTGITSSEKSQLEQHFGISKFLSWNGGINTVIGFAGYINADPKGEQVPAGQFAQAVEDGTEFRKGAHCIRKQIEAGGRSCTAKMQKQLDEEIDKRQ